MIEPLRLIGLALFVLSFPMIKTAYDKLKDQEETETPDLSAIYRNKKIGKVGIFFFLAGLVLTANGGELTF